jgi:hypothetical protein
MLRRLLAWLRGGGTDDRSGGDDRSDWSGGDDDDRSGDDDDGTVWDAMPDWAYGSGGRLQGGDLARDEQERAVEEVAEQGEKLSQVDDR